MLKPILGGLLAATILTAPLIAQTAEPAAGRNALTEASRGYAVIPSPAEPAVDAQQQPVTAALNNQVAANAGAQAAANDAQQADHAAAMSQYDMDRAAYMDALAHRDVQIDRRDARYDRQQRAYADAMSVWRIQAAECRKGHRKACNAPAPNVADFY